MKNKRKEDCGYEHTFGGRQIEDSNGEYFDVCDVCGALRDEDGGIVE